MGKTYKRYCYLYLRRPKGRKQAIINECRYGAIPPDPWDDVNHCKLVHQPWDIARKLEEKGIGRDLAAKKLVDKFHLTYAQAQDIVSTVYSDGPIFDWEFV